MSITPASSKETTQSNISQGVNVSQQKSDCNGKAYNDNGITVIDLHGTWHQMGRQYGLLAKDKMQDVLDYMDKKLGDNAERKAAAASIADKLYAHYPMHLKEFMDGVCETTGVGIERVKLCNAVEYAEGEFLCSALSVWDEYAKDKLIFGRNYDAASYSEIGKDIILTVYHPDGGMAAATVGYAGEIYCVNGFNEKGIYVELNNGMPTAGFDLHWELCPSTTQLFELLFNAGTMEDVDRFFQNNQSFASYSIGVCDKNVAHSYEWCYEGMKRGDVMTADGLMVNTNHYVNDGWDFETPTDETSWNSIIRRKNLLARAEEHKGRIDVEKMKEIMSTAIENGGPAHEFTRYQIVVVPQDMTMYIYIPSNNVWSEIIMSKYL